MTDLLKMTQRIKETYLNLYKNPLTCTKEKLAKDYDVTNKTIENSLKNIDDIYYDRDLKRYRFVSLLPKYIPYQIFYSIFSDTISNQELKKDFSLVENLNHGKNDIFMIETKQLSDISKKTIMFYIAIENNCVLNVEYTSNGRKKEKKYIKPNTLFSSFGVFYCYITYHQKNEKNVGEERTFKLTQLGSIEPDEYISSEIFKQNKKGNVFGEYKQDKYVTLIFNKISSSFFKNTNQFEDNQYEVITGIGTDYVLVKMYYNNLEIEVIKIIQQWMPHIKIFEGELLKEKIEKIIKKNYQKLISEEKEEN